MLHVLHVLHVLAVQTEEMKLCLLDVAGLVKVEILDASLWLFKECPEPGRI